MSFLFGVLSIHVLVKGGTSRVQVGCRGVGVLTRLDRKFPSCRAQGAACQGHGTSRNPIRYRGLYRDNGKEN